MSLSIICKKYIPTWWIKELVEKFMSRWTDGWTVRDERGFKLSVQRRDKLRSESGGEVTFQGPGQRKLFWTDSTKRPFTQIQGRAWQHGGPQCQDMESRTRGQIRQESSI